MKFEQFEFINFDYEMKMIYSYDFKNSICLTSDGFRNGCYHTNKRAAMQSLFAVLVLK